MKSFRQLFAGRTDCYGTYALPPDVELREDGKKKGKGTTHRKPLTDQQWSDHLGGKVMLGVVPITLDGTIGWFGIDVDIYDLNLIALAKKIDKAELPLTVCRSKSGGAHCYAFFKEPIKATDGIKIAQGLAKAIGYPKSEIFPKQTKTDKDSVGNWINLPYYGGDDTDRYAMNQVGEPLSVSEFEAYVHARLISPRDARDLLRDGGEAPADPLAEEKKVAPPCLVSFMDNPCGEGGRNNLLCHFAVLYLKMDPDNWGERVHDANKNFLEEPLPGDEVDQIIRNYSSGKYKYKCDNQPMAGRCSKEICLNRRFGIGGDVDLGFELSGLRKIDSSPPIWIVALGSKGEMSITTDQLISARLFRKAIVENLHELIPIMKDTTWAKIIMPLMVEVQVDEAPDEISIPGRIMELFHEWTKSLIERSSQKLENVLKGNPFYDDKKSVIIFRGSDFISFFRKEVRYESSDREIWKVLNDMGCENGKISIEGATTSVWTYPVKDPWFTISKGDKF